MKGIRIVVIDADQVYAYSYASDASKKIGVHRNTVVNWIKQGRTMVEKNGMRIYLTLADNFLIGNKKN